MATVRNIFHDVQSAVAASEHDVTTMPWNEQPASMQDNDWRTDWAGATPTEGRALARTGWHGVVAETDRVASRIADTVMREHDVPVWTFPMDLSGDVVDVGTFLTGEPECMIAPVMVPTPGTGRVVRIVVPTAVSASVSADTVRARGAAIVALVDVLARCGNRLEVWSWSGVSHGSRGRTSTAVLVQAADQPLDMGRIMFALAHPAWLRRIMFGVWENPANGNTPAIVTERGSGYGTPESTPPKDGDLPDDDGPSIVLPMLRARDDWSVDKAVAWIAAQLDTILAD